MFGDASVVSKVEMRLHIFRLLLASITRHQDTVGLLESGYFLVGGAALCLVYFNI